MQRTIANSLAGRNRVAQLALNDFHDKINQIVKYFSASLKFT